MADNESTTFTFQATVIGRLTLHKDELSGGARRTAARVRIEEVVARMAEPGMGPLVFEKVDASGIVFRDVEEDRTRAGRGLSSKAQS